MIPSKVKISGIEYEIAITENRKANDAGDILLGEIVYHDATIYINEEQNEQLREATLLHEIVHGILYHMGSEMNDNEKFIEGFSSGLHQVFSDNGWKFGDEQKLTTGAVPTQVINLTINNESGIKRIVRKLNEQVKQNTRMKGND
jgi:hypothetical protein